jgi:malate synthase
MVYSPCAGVTVTGPVPKEAEGILTPEAMGLVALLTRELRGRHAGLMEARKARQQEFDAGRMPDFLPETRHVRETDWQVAPAPADLQDRRVEITGPSADRKMVINALNSGAQVSMADFEDSQSPTWRNTIQGQVNVRDAIAGTIAYESPDGKRYALKEKTATLMVRPRGWHLPEKHVHIDGKPIPAGLLDFGLFLHHNAAKLLEKGSGPYLYLPKMESHREARLWNDAFIIAQDACRIPRGSIRATPLVETLPAAFEMDEILYELREHSAGLNCGRWDYIFSAIKKLREHPAHVFPDRSQVTMATPFLKSYMDLLVQTCHRRGAHAMGGMSAHIPIKADPAANEQALGKVRQDKLSEVAAGHDGAWVAHPGLVPIVQEVFDKQMTGPNQLHILRPDVTVTAADLLRVPQGTVTEEGLRSNIRVGVQYLEAWLRGTGCVPLYNLMEDAATAEISRSQLWQWLRHQARLDDGRPVTGDLVRTLYDDEMRKLEAAFGPEHISMGCYALAGNLFLGQVLGREFTEFLTLPAYEYIMTAPREV